MLKRLRLVRYKGFEQFEITFRPELNVLVGPNNAGKSTIIAVLRLCQIVLRYARRFNPSISIEDADRKRIGYPLSVARLRYLPGFTDENVHYEFRHEEARVELQTDSEAILTIVWPPDDEAYFYFDMKQGMNATRRAQIVEHSPRIGIVPGLTPIDNREEVLTEKYVNEALGSRLTSRHFRNHLHHLKQSDQVTHDAAVEFLCENTPEVSNISVKSRVSSTGLELDLFFLEATGHSERELYWTGDGMQIWLQVLFHMFRQRSEETLVLDEPDVFLHPDLQRRLVTVMEELGPQIIVATHAPEVIAEASRESVVWVDRSDRYARRVKDTSSLDRAVSDLGSAFDLGIARALRSRVALFVEGKDMKILRLFAGVAGSKTVSRERGPIAVIPLGGYSNWPMIEPFAWMKEHLLQDAVKMFVILDRDYRTPAEVKTVVSTLSGIDVKAHVWRRKELESYALVPTTIARVAGLPLGDCELLLDEALHEQAQDVQANIFSHLAKKSRKMDDKNLFEQARARFDEAWRTKEKMIESAPPKDVIAALNTKLRAAGASTISAWKVAKEMRREELPVELCDLMNEIEHAIVDRR